MLAHLDDHYETPAYIMQDIENKTGVRFNLDIAASHENHRSDRYFTRDNDALVSSWLNYGETTLSR